MIQLFAAPFDSLKHEEIYVCFNNIDMILNNSEIILQNEQYKNIRIKGTGIDGIYIGHIDLLLGDLITLWNSAKWRDDQKFYYHLGGSPLSGMSFCTYWLNGKIGCDRNKPSFGTLLESANKIIKNLNEQPNYITLPFPKRTHSNLNINDLIKILKE